MIMIDETAPRARQERAFEVLWERYRAWVRGRLRGRRVPKGAAEDEFIVDVEARIMTKLWEEAPWFRGRRSLRASLERIIVNAWLDAYRSWLARRRHEVLLTDPDAPVDAEGATAEDASTVSSPAREPALEEVLGRNRREKLTLALEWLAAEPPDGWKKAALVRLRFVEEWSIESLAEHFEVTQRTVFRRLDEALTNLREILRRGLSIGRGDDL